MSRLKIVALIPVKPLPHSKSRLSRTLTPESRAQLVHDSLRHVVYALRAVPEIQRTVVVSRDAQVAEWAEWFGAAHFCESRRGLNAALEEARAQFSLADGLLVLASDLVALSSVDVRELIRRGHEVPSRCVVIAPDRRGRGTNALLLKPPNAIPFAFGEGSARRHERLALAHGAVPVWYRSDSVALDLDCTDDLEVYWAQW
ncbi:MAG: 2-phospho-L-lactate guanylyltransferase [Anaerolineae bacterium]|nr:2-phospho-L-lactate guanylyltransferase [Thermoflexales bacterium]MDW8396435.1 2-phospho-L-lactate guanylyltransferase [Anaerolineae bacterium]